MRESHPVHQFLPQLPFWSCQWLWCYRLQSVTSGSRMMMRERSYRILWHTNTLSVQSGKTYESTLTPSNSINLLSQWSRKCPQCSAVQETSVVDGVIEVKIPNQMWIWSPRCVCVRVSFRLSSKCSSSSVRAPSTEAAI